MGAFGPIGARGLLFGVRGSPEHRAKQGSSLNVRLSDDPGLPFFTVNLWRNRAPARGGQR
jgi:hypothetical protein